MAQLGFRTVQEMIGRVEVWKPTPTSSSGRPRGLDFDKLLYRHPRCDEVVIHQTDEQDHGLELALDHQLIAQATPALEKAKSVKIDLPIRNSNRTVGAMLSGKVAKNYGEDGLPQGTIKINLTGSAGQSFGAFLAKGVEIRLAGDTNDYMGKGMNGGRIVVVPPPGSDFVPEENIIIGNVALYGATGGQAFIRGMGGERFCVRNSGVQAVIEGIGDHGCEYMTGGVAVVLGPTGRNFAAGMSGGIAFVYDPDDDFAIRFNDGLADLERLSEPEDIALLGRLIEDHLEHTGSAPARKILNDWDGSVAKFKKVMPRDYRRVLEERRETGEPAVVTAD